ncbi:helix-turn-helix transcriptional regulator [Hoeflea sp. TYP-13]|uniref:helix-turn-helix transcriptional regulator n=1 Tax=Hoeflea sp. TYP-13 TaxID=3230023 RepID=UPI0034C5CD2B
MTNMIRPGTGLWILFGVQASCALILLSKVICELAGWGKATAAGHSHIPEFLVILVLIIGLSSTVSAIRKMTSRQNRMLRQLKINSGAFMRLVEDYFDEWGLTPSEREVALLSLKGLLISDIASLRNTSQGTIKAQCNAIYRKAGVNGRPQLLSVFIEDLLALGLTRNESQTSPAK